MRSDDPDRAAILARRRRFILLALTGTAVPSSTACSKPLPCLSVGDPRWDYGDPLTTVCPAELGPAVSLLNGTQIQLPDRMTPEGMTQLAPDRVRLSFPVESVGCITDMPGGRINLFVMTVVPDDPNKSMLELRDDLLASVGYNTPVFSEEVNDEEARSYEVVIDQWPAPPVENPLADASANAGDDSARAFLRLTAHEGQVYAVMYGVNSDAWNALHASLRASATSISFSSPDSLPSPE